MKYLKQKAKIRVMNQMTQNVQKCVLLFNLN